ncbi:ABC transporter substrate-binding protein [Roseobacter sp. HKCCD9010]|uniref:heme/hemin ABC transporter substrate-binding protein n=1 Tax=unclassified Roseobacter TaxID=196798 RepID=UPI001491DCAC|nr:MULTISPECIES: ABC transporter substrate-binding protein [unclassified Roseobacter]MBF9051751.1 ABC transporter substrate-binding protein [Rhodobacterales bacterium HKCCD4356]NNV13744.1 ABC transporter substrate-binding protein [Roseobacter sp. HKCCD7357]NNV17769.1 ABC transporter substrate-binding protein [Roseobacter sp. HKCCD8768]NNV27376.1 ABC transporter substrate-binding protein [Roseobacter sp. HKCCD8192]NNV31496.1 ABC transporter substrate-binding protein [Roseobacter sp. HKCCD9061]
MMLSSARADPAERVLALGGVVTEIVYALGQGDRLVARDTTSSFPPEASDLPDVGYVRALSAEGVLSVGPDLIIAIEGSGPPETMQVLQSADIEIVTIPEGYDGDAVLEKIRVVAEALDVPEEGARLAAEVDVALGAAIAPHGSDTAPRVLFILSLQGGRIMAAGADTAAEGIIGLSGGVNAMEGFDGYQQISDEAVLLADPDVILMMDRTGDHDADTSEILTHPVLGRTSAAKNGAIVRQPGLLLLGFGPRTPEAIEALSEAFRRARG